MRGASTPKQIGKWSFPTFTFLKLYGSVVLSCWKLKPWYSNKLDQSAQLWKPFWQPWQLKYFCWFSHGIKHRVCWFHFLSCQASRLMGIWLLQSVSQSRQCQTNHNLLPSKEMLSEVISARFCINDEVYNRLSFSAICNLRVRSMKWSLALCAERISVVNTVPGFNIRLRFAIAR